MTRHFLFSIATLLLALSAASHAEPVTDLTRIVLGEYHGCGITRAGALRCFGNNGHGQLGTAQQLPLSFARYAVTVLPSGVTDVAISNTHTCAVMNRALYCWGEDTHGELGLGKTSGKVMTPARVSAVTGEVISVATSWGATCVILAPRGTLQCWGRNDQGQVGNGTNDSTVSLPVTVIPEGVTAVATARQHTCAVVNGGLQCWGLLLFSEDDSKTPQQPASNSNKASLPPVPPPVGLRTLRRPTTIIPAGKGVTAVAANLHTCVIVKESLQCWGRNFQNQVGVPEGSRVAPTKPTTIIASGVTAMAVSESSTCAVANGALMCWGSGVLGGPLTGGSKTPASVSVPGTPPATIQSVAIGMRQTCVLTGTAADRDASLLQCTNRLPDPIIHGDEAVANTKEWQNFGTEGVGLAGPPPVLPRIVQYGLWQGTIGTLDVMSLLQPTDCGAVYYYKKHLWGIELYEKDRRQSSLWQESPGTDHEATWTFSAHSPDGRTLAGEWQSRDGKRRLPIRLTLVAPTPSTPDKDGKPRYDCSRTDNAFNAPRIAQARQKRTVNPNATLFPGADGSYRYHSVSLFGGQINGITLADSRRNPRLQKSLEDWENANITEYYGCALGMTKFNQTTPDYHRELAPLFWNKSTLVLRETYSMYCGGAHPDGGVYGYQVWDLTADRPVNIWTWITGTDAEYTGRITSEKLRNLITSRYSRSDDDCSDALNSQEFYMMYPAKTGMVFTPSLPHVIQACADDILIPWAEMRPFLSPAGRKALSNVSGP